MEVVLVMISAIYIISRRTILSLNRWDTDTHLFFLFVLMEILPRIMKDIAGKTGRAMLTNFPVTRFIILYQCFLLRKQRISIKCKSALSRLTNSIFLTWK